MIKSSLNDNFKRWKELLSSRGIKKHGQFLIFGKNPCHEVLQDNPENVLEVLMQESQNLEFSLPHHIRCHLLASELFGEIDVFGIKQPILICRVPEMKNWNPKSDPSGFEIICPIGDPSNLGACLRSSLAFQADQVILLTEAAHPFHPKSIRALSSNPFLLSLAQGPSLKDLVKEPPSKLVALDMKGESLNGFRWSKQVRLLVGEEGPGLPRDKTKFTRVSIAISDSVESLNATVAASIAMFAYRGQHPLDRQY